MKNVTSTLMYKYLLILVISSAFGFQGWRTMFNNFVVEKINFEGVDVGIMQSVREVPGFFVFLVIFVLLLIKEHTLSALSIILLGLGVGLTGFLPTFGGVIFTTILMSVGFHFFETTNKSLTIQYFNKEQSAFVFAKLRGYGALSNIVAGALVIVLTRYLDYKYCYLFFGSVVVIAGIYMLTHNPENKDIAVQRKGLFLKKEYWLYYMLNFLGGARRQIFIVFAIFLMVKRYDFSVVIVGILFVLNDLVTYLCNPLIAKYLNKYGERKMLTLEYIVLSFVFVGYAFIDYAIVIAVLYVIDNLFFNFSIALNTYLQKIAKPEDIAPTNAVGFAINHITAVFIPLVLGIVWMFNWRIPFIVGGILAIISLLFVQKIKLDNK